MSRPILWMYTVSATWFWTMKMLQNLSSTWGTHKNWLFNAVAEKRRQQIRAATTVELSYSED